MSIKSGPNIHPHSDQIFVSHACSGYRGNRAFRALVKDHQEKYLNAKKRDKPSVASIIVDLIREKGGRFLRRYGTDHMGQVQWVDIGDDRAREVSQSVCRYSD